MHAKLRGPDDIPTFILKECKDNLIGDVSALFNMSLSKGRGPIKWKQANVAPIFKKGNKELKNLDKALENELEYDNKDTQLEKSLNKESKKAIRKAIK